MGKMTKEQEKTFRTFMGKVQEFFVAQDKANKLVNEEFIKLNKEISLLQGELFKLKFPEQTDKLDKLEEVD